MEAIDKAIIASPYSLDNVYPLINQSLHQKLQTNPVGGKDFNKQPQ